MSPRVVRACIGVMAIIVCGLVALGVAFLVVLGSPWLLLSEITGGLIGWGVVWIGGKVLVRRKSLHERA